MKRCWDCKRDAPAPGQGRCADCLEKRRVRRARQRAGLSRRRCRDCRWPLADHEKARCSECAQARASVERGPAVRSWCLGCGTELKADDPQALRCATC